MMRVRGLAALAATVAAGLMAGPVLAVEGLGNGPLPVVEPLPAVVRIYEPGYIVDGSRMWAYAPPASRGYGGYDGRGGYAPRGYGGWRPRPYGPYWSDGPGWSRYGWRSYGGSSGRPGYHRFYGGDRGPRDQRYGYAAPRYAEVAPWRWRSWSDRPDWSSGRYQDWRPYWRAY